MRNLWFAFILFVFWMLFASAVVLSTIPLILVFDLSAVGMFSFASYYIGLVSHRRYYIKVLCWIGKWDYIISKKIYWKWFKIDYTNTFGWWLLTQRAINNVNTAKRLFADDEETKNSADKYSKL